LQADFRSVEEFAKKFLQKSHEETSEGNIVLLFFVKFVGGYGGSAQMFILNSFW